MKHIPLVLLVLIPFIGGSQNIDPKKNTHATINAAGGNFSDNGGIVSYSIGQVFFSSHHTSENHILEGVQQPLVINISPPEKAEKRLQVGTYPNPVTRVFIIRASNFSERSLEYHLMDLQGRLIKEGRIENSKTKVNIANVPVAIYLLMISDNGTRIKTIKIIKK